MHRKTIRRPWTDTADLRGYIARVNAAALPRLEELCRDWTTGGQRVGEEFVARNPIRADRRAGSFRINLRTGIWADFATGDAGGDPVALYAYLHGLPQLAAAKALANRLGVAR